MIIGAAAAPARTGGRPGSVGRLRAVARTAVALWIVAAAAACVPKASMPEARAWEVKGVMVATHDGTLSLRHKSGHVVTLVVDDRTTYSRRGEPAGHEALVPGLRVRVRVETFEDVQYARHVEISRGRS